MIRILKYILILYLNYSLNIISKNNFPDKSYYEIINHITSSSLISRSMLNVFDRIIIVHMHIAFLTPPPPSIQNYHHFQSLIHMLSRSLSHIHFLPILAGFQKTSSNRCHLSSLPRTTSINLPR